jgi:hypothetical protein
MRERRTLSSIFAVLLAAPLAAVGVCGALAPLAPSSAVCPLEADAGGDCCARPSSPASSRTPTPDRCAACSAAACAQLAGKRDEAAPSRRARPSEVAARPTAVHASTRTHRAASLVALSESPPKNVLLVTFRN